MNSYVIEVLNQIIDKKYIIPIKKDFNLNGISFKIENINKAFAFYIPKNTNITNFNFPNFSTPIIKSNLIIFCEYKNQFIVIISNLKQKKEIISYIPQFQLTISFINFLIKLLNICYFENKELNINYALTLFNEKNITDKRIGSKNFKNSIKINGLNINIYDSNRQVKLNYL